MHISNCVRWEIVYIQRPSWCCPTGVSGRRGHTRSWGDRAAASGPSPHSGHTLLQHRWITLDIPTYINYQLYISTYITYWLYIWTYITHWLTYQLTCILLIDLYINLYNLSTYISTYITYWVIYQLTCI